MNDKMKTAGVIASAAVLAMGSTSAFAAVADAAPTDGPAAALEVTDGARAADATAPARVEGSFSFDQNAVTSNEEIASVFVKAATSLCADLPEYSVQQAEGAIRLKLRDQIMDAYVADVEAGETTSLVMGCACGTNGPGGGAIANAEVEGVSLAALLTMMGA